MITSIKTFFLVVILLATTLATPNTAGTNHEKIITSLEPKNTKIVGVLQSILETAEEDQEIRVIVELREEIETKTMSPITLEKLVEKRRKLQEKIVEDFGRRNIFVEEKHWVVNALTLEATPKQIEEIATDPRVERIWPDLRGHIQTLGENASQGKHSEEVQADVLRKLVSSLNGSGVKIGFIDTGIDNNVIQKVEKEKDFTDDKNNVPSGEHGTHVAGIVAGNTNQGVEGIAPGVTIYDAKVQDQAGKIYMSWVIKAIEWLLDPDRDPNTDDGADIINSSVAFFPYQTYCECQTPGCTPKECDTWPDYPLAGLTPLSRAIENVVEQGVVFVGATGNRGPGNSSLAILPTNAIRVAAPELDPGKGFYSSIGPSPQGDIGVDLIAPGKNVLSTTPNGAKQKTGTSQAAPYVAGVAALLLQKEKLRPDQVKTRLMNGAIPYEELLAHQQGAGVVNALTAVYPQLTSNREMLSYGPIKPGEEKTIKTQITNKNKYVDLSLKAKRSKLVNTAFSDWSHEAIHIGEKEFGPITVEAGKTLELEEEIVKIKAENEEIGRSLAPGTYVGVLTLSLEEPIEIPIANFVDGEHTLLESGLGVDLNDDGDKNDSWILQYNTEGKKVTVKTQNQELVTAEPGKNIYFQTPGDTGSLRVFTYMYDDLGTDNTDDDKLVFDVQLRLPISFIVPAVAGADNPLVYTTKEEIEEGSAYLTGKSDNFDYFDNCKCYGRCDCQTHYGDYTYFTLLVPPESKALELRQTGSLRTDPKLGCEDLKDTGKYFDAYIFDKHGNMVQHTETSDLDFFRLNDPEPGVYTVIINSDTPPGEGKSCFQYHFRILENKLVEVTPDTWEETVVTDPISKTWSLENTSVEKLSNVAVIGRALQPIETRTYTGVVYQDDHSALVFIANANRDSPGHQKLDGTTEYTYHRKYPIPSNIVMLDLELVYQGPGDLDLEVDAWYDADHDGVVEIDPNQDGNTDDSEYFFVTEATSSKRVERARVILDDWRHLDPTPHLGHWDEPTDIIVKVLNAGIDQDIQFELKAVFYGYVPWNQVETPQGALSWSVVDENNNNLETLFPGYNLVGWETINQGETKSFKTTLTGVSALTPGEEHFGVIWIVETREVTLSEVTGIGYDSVVGKYKLQEVFDEDNDGVANEDPADLGPDCDHVKDPYCCTKYPDSCATVQRAVTNNNLDDIDNDWNGCIALPGSQGESYDWTGDADLDGILDEDSLLYITPRELDIPTGGNNQSYPPPGMAFGKENKPYIEAARYWVAQLSEYKGSGALGFDLDRDNSLGPVCEQDYKVNDDYDVYIGVLLVDEDGDNQPDYLYVDSDGDYHLGEDRDDIAFKGSTFEVYPSPVGVKGRKNISTGVRTFRVLDFKAVGNNQASVVIARKLASIPVVLTVEPVTLEVVLLESPGVIDALPYCSDSGCRAVVDPTWRPSDSVRNTSATYRVVLSNHQAASHRYTLYIRQPKEDDPETEEDESEYLSEQHKAMPLHWVAHHWEWLENGWVYHPGEDPKAPEDPGKHVIGWDVYLPAGGEKVYTFVVKPDECASAGKYQFMLEAEPIDSGAPPIDPVPIEIWVDHDKTTNDYSDGSLADLDDHYEVELKLFREEDGELGEETLAYRLRPEVSELPLLVGWKLVSHTTTQEKRKFRIVYELLKEDGKTIQNRRWLPSASGYYELGCGETLTSVSTGDWLDVAPDPNTIAYGDPLSLKVNVFRLPEPGETNPPVESQVKTATILVSNADDLLSIHGNQAPENHDEDKEDRIVNLKPGDIDENKWLALYKVCVERFWHENRSGYTLYFLEGGDDWPHTFSLSDKLTDLSWTSGVDTGPIPAKTQANEKWCTYLNPAEGGFHSHLGLEVEELAHYGDYNFFILLEPNSVDDDGDWREEDDLDGNGEPSLDWDGPAGDVNGDGDPSYDPEPSVDEDPYGDLASDGWPGIGAVDDDQDTPTGENPLLYTDLMDQEVRKGIVEQLSNWLGLSLGDLEGLYTTDLPAQYDDKDNDSDWDPVVGDTGCDNTPGTADQGEGDGKPTSWVVCPPGSPGEANVDEEDETYRISKDTGTISGTFLLPEAENGVNIPEEEEDVSKVINGDDDDLDRDWNGDDTWGLMPGTGTGADLNDVDLARILLDLLDARDGEYGGDPNKRLEGYDPRYDDDEDGEMDEDARGKSSYDLVEGRIRVPAYPGVELSAISYPKYVITANLQGYGAYVGFQTLLDGEEHVFVVPEGLDCLAVDISLDGYTPPSSCDEPGYYSPGETIVVAQNMYHIADIKKDPTKGKATIKLNVTSAKLIIGPGEQSITFSFTLHNPGNLDSKYLLSIKPSNNTPQLPDAWTSWSYNQALIEVPRRGWPYANQKHSNGEIRLTITLPEDLELACGQTLEYEFVVEAEEITQTWWPPNLFNYLDGDYRVKGETPNSAQLIIDEIVEPSLRLTNPSDILIEPGEKAYKEVILANGEQQQTYSIKALPESPPSGWSLRLVKSKDGSEEMPPEITLDPCETKTFYLEIAASKELGAGSRLPNIRVEASYDDQVLTTQGFSAQTPSLPGQTGRVNIRTKTPDEEEFVGDPNVDDEQEVDTTIVLQTGAEGYADIRVVNENIEDSTIDLNLENPPSGLDAQLVMFVDTSTTLQLNNSSSLMYNNTTYRVRGDRNNDGWPGIAGVDDDNDGKADLNDPEVRGRIELVLGLDTDGDLDGDGVVEPSEAGTTDDLKNSIILASGDGLDNDSDWTPANDLGCDYTPGTADQGEGDGKPTSWVVCPPGSPGEANVDEVGERYNFSADNNEDGINAPGETGSPIDDLDNDEDAGVAPDNEWTKEASNGIDYNDKEIQEIIMDQLDILGETTYDNRIPHPYDDDYDPSKHYDPRDDEDEDGYVDITPGLRSVSGNYHIGLISENNAVDLDGDNDFDERSWAVLVVDPETSGNYTTVFVDSDSDQVFSDETALMVGNSFQLISETGSRRSYTITRVEANLVEFRFPDSNYANDCGLSQHPDVRLKSGAHVDLHLRVKLDACTYFEANPTLDVVGRTIFLEECRPSSTDRATIEIDMEASSIHDAELFVEPVEQELGMQEKRTEYKLIIENRGNSKDVVRINLDILNMETGNVEGQTPRTTWSFDVAYYVQLGGLFNFGLGETSIPGTEYRIAAVGDVSTTTSWRFGKLVEKDDLDGDGEFTSTLAFLVESPTNILNKTLRIFVDLNQNKIFETNEKRVVKIDAEGNLFSPRGGSPTSTGEFTFGAKTYHFTHQDPDSDFIEFKPIDPVTGEELEVAPLLAPCIAIDYLHLVVEADMEDRQMGDYSILPIWLEINNQRVGTTRSVKTTIAAVHDVAIIVDEVVPEKADPGDDIRVTVRVVNKGDLEEHNLRVEMRIAGEKASETIEVLRRNGETQVTLVWRTDDEQDPDLYQGTVEVTLATGIEDHNPGDNTRTFVVFVRPTIEVFDGVLKIGERFYIDECRHMFELRTTSAGHPYYPGYPRGGFKAVLEYYRDGRRVDQVLIEEDEEEELRIAKGIDAIIDTDFVDVVEQSAGFTILVDYEPIFENTRIPEGYSYEDESDVTDTEYLVRVKSINTTKDPPVAVLEIEEDGDELDDSPLTATPGKAYWLENGEGEKDAIIVVLGSVYEEDGRRIARVSLYAAPFTEEDAEGPYNPRIEGYDPCMASPYWVPPKEEIPQEPAAAVPEPKVLVEKRLEKSVVEVGEPVTIRVILANDSEGVAKDVKLDDSKLPAGLRLTEGSPTWEGTLDPYEQQVIEYTIKPLRKGLFDIPRAVITYKDVNDKEYWVESTGTWKLSVVTLHPKIEAQKNVHPVEAYVGGTITISISVANRGEGPARSVEIRDVITPGLTPETTPNKKEELLQPGATTTLTYTVRAEQAGVYTLEQAEITYLDGDAKKQSTTTPNQPVVTVAEPAEVVLTKSVSPPRVVEGGTAQVTIRVENVGSGEAKNVRVIDKVAPGTMLTPGSKLPGEEFKLGPGETKLFTYFITATQPGTITLPAPVISYKDELGRLTQKTAKTQPNLTIVEKKKVSTHLILLLLLVAIAAAMIIYYYGRRKR